MTNDYTYFVKVVDKNILSDDVILVKTFKLRFQVILFLFYFVYKKFRDWDTAYLILGQRRIKIEDAIGTF